MSLDLGFFALDAVFGLTQRFAREGASFLKSGN